MTEAGRCFTDLLPGDAERDGALTGLVLVSPRAETGALEEVVLPALCGLGYPAGAGARPRLALERRLAGLVAAALVVDSRSRVPAGRPMSLDVVPFAPGAGRPLGARLVLALSEHAVRLIVTTADLTRAGVGQDLAACVKVAARADAPEAAAVVHAALGGLPGELFRCLPREAREELDRARHRVAGWIGRPAASSADTFHWSGGPGLARALAERWPAGEPVQRVRVVSPEWGDDTGEMLATVLEPLQRAGALQAGAEVRLLVSALRDAAGRQWPIVSRNMETIDLARFGVRVGVQIADLRAASVGAPGAAAGAGGPGRPGAHVRLDCGATSSQGRCDGHGTVPDAGVRMEVRVVLLEGPQTALLYVGSASPSAADWGGASDRSGLALHGGVILRRQGAARASFAALVPAGAGPATPPSALSARRYPGGANASPGTGKAVQADTVAPGTTPVPAPSPAMALRRVHLAPDARDPRRVELMLDAFPDRLPATWRLQTLPRHPGAAGTVIGSPPTGSARQEHHRIALTPEQLAALRADRTVQLVALSGNPYCPEGPHTPVTLAPELKCELGFTAERAPESCLVAYYRGITSWEDALCAPPIAIAARGAGTAGDAGVARDTRVDEVAGAEPEPQAEAVRAFLEAMPGVAEDLAWSLATVPVMRMALFGPVSPVALARAVRASVDDGQRSLTAAGFQLVELLAVVRQAFDHPLPAERRLAWIDLLHRAEQEITSIIATLSLPPTTPPFDRFRHAVGARR